MIQKSIATGVVVEGMLNDLQALGLVVEPFTPEDGLITGQLWQQTQQYGLSLGDRACLSLGLRLNVPVLTSDRVWTNLALSLEVRVIR